MKFKFPMNALLAVWLLLLTGCGTAPTEPHDIQSVEDMRTARIGVILGSTQDAYITQQMPEAEIVRIETETDIFLALLQGKCDVTVCDQSIFGHAQAQYPELQLIPNNFPPSHYGIGFQKESTTLQSLFNAFLKELRTSGLYDEIYDRWIVNGTESSMPAIESYTQGEPLRVAVAGSQYPFNFLKDQQFVGFDSEIIRRFAARLKRPIEYQSITFGSLIAALQAGKVDVISAAMTITEERSKMVLFSDPYFETYTAVATVARQDAEESGSFWQQLKESFQSNLLREKRYLLIWNGLKTTLAVSFFSILLGTLLGGVICYMRMSKNRWLNTSASIYITLMRGMPVLVLLMLMFYVFLAKLPINGVQVAILTFSLNFSAYVCEMFRTSIQSVDRGQTEAGIALGFTPVQTFYHIVMPQAIKSVLPVYKGEMISLIKTTSIVGYIAVEDLTKMSDIIRSRTFDAFFPLIMVAILYFILAWLFGKALDMLNPKQQPEA